MEMIGILPSYNTMKCQPQSMSGTLLGTYHKMSATVSVWYWNVIDMTYSMKLSGIEMSYTWPIAGMGEITQEA